MPSHFSRFSSPSGNPGNCPGFMSHCTGLDRTLPPTRYSSPRETTLVAKWWNFGKVGRIGGGALMITSVLF